MNAIRFYQTRSTYFSFLCTVLSFLFVQVAVAQADSLITLYSKLPEGKYEEVAIGHLSTIENNTETEYLLIKEYLKIRFDQEDNAYGYSLLAGHEGYRYMNRGLYDSARICLSEAIAYAQSAANLYQEGVHVSVLGNVEYFQGNSLKAGELWGRAASIFEQIDDTINIARSYVNMGVVYLQIGYYQSSFLSFEKGTQLMELSGFQDEDYQVAKVNKAVACISLRLLDEAKVILREVQTDSISDYVQFLVYMNQALIGIRIDNEQEFLTNADRAIDMVSSFLPYKWVLNEVLVEGYLQFNKVDEARVIVLEFLDLLQSDQAKNEIPGLAILDLWMTQTGEDLLSDELVSRLKAYDTQRVALSERRMLYEMFADHAADLLRFKEALYWQKKADSLMHVELDSSMYTQYLDFAMAYRTEQLEQEKETLALEVEKKNLELLSNQFRNMLLTIITGSVLLLLVALIYVWRKRKALEDQQRTLQEKEWTLQQQENVQLQQQNNRQEMEIQRARTLMSMVKKVDDTISPLLQSVSGQLGDEYKQDLKDVQFLLYEIETHINNLQVSNEVSEQLASFVSRIREKFTDLSEVEATVCGFVRIGYSSKEIAELLRKTEKSIENYRSRARQKMQIDPQISLPDYLKTL